MEYKPIPPKFKKVEKKSEPKKEEGDKKEHRGISKSDFLYMEPTKEDNPKTFATCAGCAMFLDKHNICSLHGKDVKILPFYSCGLFVRGKAPESEMEHVSAKVTPEESGLIYEVPQCERCHYYDKDGDCNLFRLLNIEDYKVEKNACCNAWSKKS